MISKNIASDLVIVVVLAMLQIFILNRVSLGGYIPVMYPLFVMFYPFFRNQYIFLFFSFLLGLIIDGFLGKWGMNAFATTTIAYFRTIIFRTSTDVSTDFFSFQSLQWSQFLFFILTSIFIHQFVVQYIEFFTNRQYFDIFISIIFTTLISFIFILIYALIFRVKEKV